MTVINGRIGDTSGAPYLEGALLLPNQGISARISFLVDTGADSTTLMPMDGRNFGLDYSRLTNVATATGVGGATKTFLEPAILTFLDEGRGVLHSYVIDMDIIPPHPDLCGIKSLLGRDVLKHWGMRCDMKRDRVTFTVHYADVSDRL